MFATLMAFLTACSDDEHPKLDLAIRESPAQFLGIVNDFQDGDGFTLLTRALIAGRYQCATTLLAHGANPNKADGGGRFPLDLVGRNPDVLRMLLVHGLRANQDLFEATFPYLDDEACKRVIDCIPGFDANRPFADGESPLVHAVCRKLVGTIGYLIKRGAKVNVTDAKGRTAAHIAAYKYKEQGKPYDEILGELTGCDMQCVDAFGYTPGCIIRKAMLGQFYIM
jgi:hypothetical protein